MADMTASDAVHDGATEADLDAPWMPPGLTFKVGDMVRFRVQGECEAHAKYPPKTLDLLDGAVGMIDWIGPCRTPGHPVHVVLNEVVPAFTSQGEPAPMTGTLASLSELIPLGADADRPDDGEGRGD